MKPTKIEFANVSIPADTFIKPRFEINPIIIPLGWHRHSFRCYNGTNFSESISVWAKENSAGNWIGYIDQDVNLDVYIVLLFERLEDAILFKLSDIEQSL